MRALTLTFVALSLVACSQTAAPAGLGGHWSAQGQTNLTLDLSQNGSNVAGRANLTQGVGGLHSGQFTVTGTAIAQQASMKLWQADALAYTLDCKQAAQGWNCALGSIPVVDMAPGTILSSQRVSTLTLVR